MELYRHELVDGRLGGDYVRDPQAEADVRLAQLLRRLPLNWELCFENDTFKPTWSVWDDTGTCVSRAITLDAALTAALGEEGNDVVS